MRKEKKYIANIINIDDILYLLKNHGSVDDNCNEKGFYYVETQYLLIWKNKNNKGKIRIRKYTSGISFRYFLENKFKVDKLSDKIRLEISEQQYYKFINNNIIENILNEIILLFPQMLFFTESIENEIQLSSINLSYKRYAYEIKINEYRYRITVDCELSSNYDSRLVNLISSDDCILEIKCEGEIDNAVNLFAPYIVKKLMKSKHKIAKKYLEKSIAAY